MANKLHWFSLPAEIRLIILELLAQENRGLASYASVCKEWVEVIEKKNFGRLKLRPSCLDDLEHMVSRRRRLVRHIWLNIELQPYTCRSCQWIESPSWLSSNNSVISRAILKLFTTLATWDAAGDSLTLELSVHPLATRNTGSRTVISEPTMKMEMSFSNPKTRRRNVYTIQDMAGSTANRSPLLAHLLCSDSTSGLG